MIYCSDLRCKYCNDKGKCTNKKIELTMIGINTVNQGFQHLHKCESYEESDFLKKYRPFIDKLVNDKKIEEGN